MKRDAKSGLAIAAVAGASAEGLPVCCGRRPAAWHKAVRLALPLLVIVGATGGVAWAAGGHGGGGHGPGDLHINWWAWDAHAPPVGWFIVDFLIFVWLLVHFTKKPVRQALAQRHQTIKREVAEAGTALDEARTRHETYKEKLAVIDSEASQLVASGQEDGEQERRRIVLEAEDYAERLRRENSSVMTQEGEKARERLRIETAREVLALAERTLRETLTNDDRERLLEESIRGLGADEASTGAVATMPSSNDSAGSMRRAAGGAA